MVFWLLYLLLGVGKVGNNYSILNLFANFKLTELFKQNISSAFFLVIIFSSRWIFAIKQIFTLIIIFICFHHGAKWFQISWLEDFIFVDSCQLSWLNCVIHIEIWVHCLCHSWLHATVSLYSEIAWCWVSSSSLAVTIYTIADWTKNGASF